MSKKYDVAQVSKLLNELEQCADRIHKIAADFLQETQVESVKKAA
jgi:hypothetical protein